HARGSRCGRGLQLEPHPPGARGRPARQRRVRRTARRPRAGDDAVPVRLAHPQRQRVGAGQRQPHRQQRARDHGVGGGPQLPAALHRDAFAEAGADHRLTPRTRSPAPARRQAGEGSARSIAMDALATVLTALVASPGQHARLLRLHTPLGPEVLVAERLSGVEAVDAGFRLEVAALSIDAHLSLDALLGQPVLLELLTADSHTDLRPFHGHVTAFEREGSNGGLARYRLVVEPWLAFLRQRVDSYVFQDKTVMEIVEDVFADYAEAGALVLA